MKPWTIFLAVCAFLCATPLGAASTAWQSNEHGRVRLLSEYKVAPKSGEILLGLHFQPKPGWYVYWKDPGEAGIPPRVNWTHTHGLSNLEILFPQPTKFLLPGNITEYGYEGESVYPIRAVIKGGAIQITARLSYLTCNTSCVPYTYTFSLDVPQGNNPVVDPEAESLIQRSLSRVPPKGMTDAEIKAGAPAKRKNLNEPIPAPSGSPALLGMLLVAFLGGLILNVMPCVLPVLSIKLTGLLQHSGQSHSTVVKGALASAAGILVSFQGLAVAAVLARQAGHAIGWGIQFQNPVFVTFLLIVVLLFALNLWGIFEINMPHVVGRFATTYGYHETLTAHFMSGLFATLLATPCSAPFLGTAMGFALSQSSQTILVIFLAVGMGMALPYFSLAVFPQAIHWLPKPGHWMLSLKKVLALFLLATAAWLGWVLYQQMRHTPPSAESISEGLAWESFDEASIQRYLRQGKPVFVDVTADWCVTCKYNERFVLGDAEVRAELSRQNVVMMKADWTNHDQAIANYLMKHGRAGIPFYAFYRPGRPPVLLSEFLTKTQVLKALQS